MGSAGAAGEVQDSIASDHFVLFSSKLPRGEGQNNSYAEPLVISHDQQLHMSSFMSWQVFLWFSPLPPTARACSKAPIPACEELCSAS